MSWNPNSAFPRQSTYTPGVGLRVQPAVNAPRFGDVGTGGARQQPLDSAYHYAAANAARLAYGAPGGQANVRALQGQHGKITQGVDSAVRRQSQRASQMMSRGGLGRPGSAAANELFARGADVAASAMTPLSVAWDPSTAPPVIKGRQNQPWDNLLDPNAEPAFDKAGRRLSDDVRTDPVPAVTSRARPKARSVTNPFQQPLF